MPLFRMRAGSQDQIGPLYWATVEQARQAVFYTGFAVPDSLDGRFEMIALHVALIIERFGQDDAEESAQELFDYMFRDMDRSLREMGASDLGVGKRVKNLAGAFYGRLAAYREALSAEDGDATLIAALRRDVFGTAGEGQGDAEALAGYVRAAWETLAKTASGTILAGSFRWPNPAEQLGDAA